jgi:sulfur carrier protein ThiS
MKINVKLVGLFQTGRFKQKDMDYPDGTQVQQVMDALLLPEQLFGIVLINGTHADTVTLLSEGDQLVLMPIVDGG